MKNKATVPIWGISTLVGGICLVPGMAVAQDATLPSAEASKTFETVTVTARRRDESQLDVPVSVTVMGTEALDRYATADITALGSQIPQVMFSKNPSGNGANINIRGVGTNTTADDGVDQAVSVNIDGVPTARGRILQTGLFDISNVQVLKGPQALYFGRNSPGGVIIIESQKPTDAFEGYARAGFEFQAKEYFGEAAISGPISDSLTARFAMRASDMTEGYVRNIAGPISAEDNPVAYDSANGLAIPGRAFEWGPGSSQIAGRLSLNWEPTENVSALLRVFASNYEDEGDASQNVIVSCTAGATQSASVDLSNTLYGNPPQILLDPYSYCGGDRRVTTSGQPADEIVDGLPFNRGGDTAFTKNTNYLSSLVVDVDLGSVDLTSTTTYYEFDNEGNSDSGVTTFALASGGANSYYSSWSEELRALIELTPSLSASVGAFYGYDRRRYLSQPRIIHYVDPDTGNSATAVGNMFTTGDTFSVFGELSWEITDDLELSGGARYTEESRDGTLQNDYVSPPGLQRGIARPVGDVVTGRMRNDNVSPQLTLTWRVLPTASVYAGYRTGFKAGAITNPGLVTPSLNDENVVLDPETVRGYEAGLKFSDPGLRLSGDIAVYNYIYRNLQVSAFNSETQTVLTQNAGGAQVSGIEGSINFFATDNLSVHAAGGYNRARYTTFTDAACWGGQSVAQGCTNNQQNVTGEPLPRAPEFSMNAGLAWDGEIASGYGLNLTADARYSSSYNFVSTNNPFANQDEFVTLDASARIRTPAGWELALIGRNLTDEFYFVIGSERPLGVSPGSVQGVPGQPRTVTVQATYNF